MLRNCFHNCQPNGGMVHKEFRFSCGPKGSNSLSLSLFHVFPSFTPPCRSCKQGTELSTCLVPACGCTLHPQTTLCFRQHALIAPKIEEDERCGRGGTRWQTKTQLAKNYYYYFFLLVRKQAREMHQEKKVHHIIYNFFNSREKINRSWEPAETQEVNALQNKGKFLKNLLASMTHFSPFVTLEGFLFFFYKTES